MIKSGIEHPILKPSTVRWVFLAGDALSFLIQAGGGGLTAISNQTISQNGK